MKLYVLYFLFWSQIYKKIAQSAENNSNKLGDVLKNHTKTIYNSTKKQNDEDNLLKQETHKLLNECGVETPDNNWEDDDYNNRRGSNKNKRGNNYGNNKRRNSNKRYNNDNGENSRENDDDSYDNKRYSNRNRGNRYSNYGNDNDDEDNDSNNHNNKRNGNRRNKNNSDKRYGNNNNRYNNENYSDESDEDSNDSNQSNYHKRNNYNNNNRNNIRRYNRTSSGNSGYNNGYNYGYDNRNNKNNYGNNGNGYNKNNDCRVGNNGYYNSNDRNEWKPYGSSDGNYGFDNRNYGYNSYGNNGNMRRAGSSPEYPRNFDYNLRVRRSNNNDESQCVSQCVFGYLEVLDDNRVPSETLVVKWLQEHLSNDMKRIRALREARRCFARLSTSDTDDGCDFSQSLSKCLNLELE